MAQAEKFMAAVETAGENGIDVNTLMTILKTEKAQSVHAVACVVRKKGFKIKTNHGRYFFIEQVKGELTVAPTKLGENALMVERASGLSSQDREKYLEMIQQSMFYKKTAEALVTASDFRKSIERKLT